MYSQEIEDFLDIIFPDNWERTFLGYLVRYQNIPVIFEDQQHDFIENVFVHFNIYNNTMNFFRLDRQLFNKLYIHPHIKIEDTTRWTSNICTGDFNLPDDTRFRAAYLKDFFHSYNRGGAWSSGHIHSYRDNLPISFEMVDKEDIRITFVVGSRGWFKPLVEVDPAKIKDKIPCIDEVIFKGQVLKTYWAENQVGSFKLKDSDSISLTRKYV